jgi:hypothetical protein
MTGSRLAPERFFEGHELGLDAYRRVATIAGVGAWLRAAWGRAG